MRMFLVLAIGYVIGARAGSEDVDEIVQSVKALRDSDEFADVVSAVRTHAGRALHELATIVDGTNRASLGTGMGGSAASFGGRASEGDAGDLVDRVRQLFGRA